MRVSFAGLLLVCVVPCCYTNRQNDDCVGPEYSGLRTDLRITTNDSQWLGMTLLVGGACTNPRCDGWAMSKCYSWRFDASGPTGSVCDLTWTLPNGTQCHQTLKLPRATESCPSMNGGFTVSELEGDCTAADAQ